MVTSVLKFIDCPLVYIEKVGFSRIETIKTQTSFVAFVRFDNSRNQKTHTFTSAVGEEVQYHNRILCWFATSEIHR